MAETDKLNIDNIIARLLEGKTGRSPCTARRSALGPTRRDEGGEEGEEDGDAARLARYPYPLFSPIPFYPPARASARFLATLSDVPRRRPSRPVSSHPIPSHPIPFHSIPFRPCSLSSLSLSRASRNAVPTRRRYAMSSKTMLTIDSRH